MSNRPLFLLGLLLGAFTAFRLRLPKPPPAFLDLTDDAFVACDRVGRIVKTNAAAQELFGLSSLPALRYPTGQPVPPGQHPLKRVALSRESYSGAYRFTSADGSERTVEVSAKPGPNKTSLALFRDVSVLHESSRRAQEASARQEIVQTLCRRLGEVESAGAIGRAVTEEVSTLFNALPGVQAKLWMLDPLTDTLTCLASCPDDAPKRPKFVAQSQSLSVHFDAQSPELWQLYVARKPFENSLPLVAGGVAIGHLSVIVPSTELERETLGMIASVAALALAGASAKAQTAGWAAQSAAVREIAAAMQAGRPGGELADLATAQIKRLVGADVCTLSVPINGMLSVRGQAFTDDLISPATAPNAPCLHGKTVQKASRTQKMVVQTGIANPSVEAGPWRAFAGSVGRHSIVAIPLAEKRGVLAVYTAGERALPDVQIKFLQTIAALLSVSLLLATATADGAD